MDDKQMSVSVAVAWGMWFLAAVFAVANTMTHHQIGALSVVFACAAGTLHIRGFLCRQAREEREAFELGVDVGRSRPDGDRVIRMR